VRKEKDDQRNSECHEDKHDKTLSNNLSHEKTLLSFIYFDISAKL
jgi:hypothetical protein